jgi:hypothetical protein
MFIPMLTAHEVYIFILIKCHIILVMGILPSSMYAGNGQGNASALLFSYGFPKNHL